MPCCGSLRPRSRTEPATRQERKLLCEHSPIRELLFDFQRTGLKHRMSMHFVRAQREDRMGTGRDGLPLGISGDPGNLGRGRLAEYRDGVGS